MYTDFSGKAVTMLINQSKAVLGFPQNLTRVAFSQCQHNDTILSVGVTSLAQVQRASVVATVTIVLHMRPASECLIVWSSNMHLT